jgi:glycosyltransferase involved in cell wall biosynthesis
MNILFITVVKGHGKGGHFNSMNHISKSFGNQININILTIGPSRSKVLEENPHFYKHLHSNGFNILELRQSILSITKELKTNILHCFTDETYSLIRGVLIFKKFTYVINKNGGENPKDFPKVDNLVLFSVENFKWFKSNKKFQTTQISLIPNRVQQFKLENQESIGIEKLKDKFTFVRIGRIGKTYKKSFEDSIRLFEYLNTKFSNKIIMYFIGAIEENNVYLELKKYIEDNKLNIIFLTDDKYTINASKMLYIADAVIASGRGVMEACSLGLPSFTLAENSKYPILIDPQSFDSFFETNFSQRNHAIETCLNLTFLNAEKLINNVEFYNSISEFSKHIFYEHFDIKSGTIKYIDFYKQSIANRNYISFIKNFKFFCLAIKSLYSASKKLS